MVVPVQKVERAEKLNERRLSSEAEKSTVVVENLAAKRIIAISAMGWSTSRKGCWTSLIWPNVSQMSMKMERDTWKLRIRQVGVEIENDSRPEVDSTGMNRKGEVGAVSLAQHGSISHCPMRACLYCRNLQVIEEALQ